MLGHTWQAGSHLKVWNVFAGAAALENSGSAESAAHGHQDMPHVARFTPTCSCTRTRTPAHGHPCTSVRVGDEDWRRRPHEQAHTTRPRPGPTKPDARPREPRTRRSPNLGARSPGRPTGSGRDTPSRALRRGRTGDGISNARPRTPGRGNGSRPGGPSGPGKTRRCVTRVWNRTNPNAWLASQRGKKDALGRRE